MSYLKTQSPQTFKDYCRGRRVYVRTSLEGREGGCLYMEVTREQLFQMLDLEKPTTITFYQSAAITTKLFVRTLNFHL